MKKISLQWRITLMTAILLCVTCVVMNCLIIYSGKHYMDVIGSGISAYSSNDVSSKSVTEKSEENDGKGESGADTDSTGESFKGLHFFLGDGFFAREIDRNLIRVKK